MRTISFILLLLLANPASGGEVFNSIYSEMAKERLAALTINNPDAKVLNSITNLPAAIRAHLPDTADAGEAFSSGCLRQYAGNRFLTASKVGNVYFVAIEHGGIAYNWSITAFVVSDTGNITLKREVDQVDAANRDQPVTLRTNGPVAAEAPHPQLQADHAEAPPVVYVSGAFQNPGIYTWTNGMTLKDAFSVAGGFTQFAWFRILLKHSDGSEERFRWSEAQPLTTNPALRPGDKVMNPRQ